MASRKMTQRSLWEHHGRAFLRPSISTFTLKPRCKIDPTFDGPVHRSCPSSPLLLLRWIVLSASLTSTKSPDLVTFSANGPMIFPLVVWRDSTLSLCLFSRACLSSRIVHQERACPGKFEAYGRTRDRKGTCWPGERGPKARISPNTRGTRSRPCALANRCTMLIAHPASSRLVSPWFPGLESILLVPIECQLSTTGTDLG